jgi:DNA (cytosine-5)-methyltransferase 1
MTPPEYTPVQTQLRDALQYMSQAELADILGVTARTLRRWVVGEVEPKSAYLTAIEHELQRDERPDRPDFTFIDLFAGIGGLRRGFEVLNGRCVYTSEWDLHAKKTYKANYPDSEEIAGDITKVSPAAIPDHDILLAGFPCQPFSLAGVSKKKSLGRAHGFKDKTQGTLFFNVVKILEEKSPRGFLLENVKNLRSHDGGRTFQVIRGALEELGYAVFEGVVNSAAWVPQRRERIFLAGFKRDVNFEFSMVERPKTPPTLRDILHSSSEDAEEPFTIRERGRTVVHPRYTLSDHLWQYLQDYAAKHKEKGNGFGCSVFTGKDIARTLSARYHKDGSEILIAQAGKNPRRLTPRECARLMGFDMPGQKPVSIPVSDTQAYRQFGNSVVVPVVEAIARVFVPRVMNPDEYPPPVREQRELFAFAS